MNFLPDNPRWQRALAILLLTACLGCARWRIPAIDPTGQRIFAPGGATTSLQVPRRGPLGGIMNPAYTAPPRPGPCLDIAPALPPTAPPVGPAPAPMATAPLTAAPTPSAPGAGFIGALPQAASGGRSIQITPGEIIAPVGSEVVLKAGLCGGDGYFVTSQPIEWLLSQESVGNIVAAGDGDEGRLCEHLCLHSSRRRTEGFAASRTSSREQTLDRGTPDRSDDVQVQSGETWVSVTSAVEGVSRVTAVAPDAASWDGRRQTATIIWIDAQWTPPAPAIVRAGQTQSLTTVVARGSDGAPVAGWIVRYEVLDGPPAQFVAPDGSAAGPMADATTDSNGQATVILSPTTNQPGTTRVRMQMINPSPSSSGNVVAVGRSFTSVTW
ncbi:MAG: hypothetical protein KDA41_07200, partial [Planctomycetales bacterium]|nr:hypothetical protein [Planctomycetales bacterium]